MIKEKVCMNMERINEYITDHNIKKENIINIDKVYLNDYMYHLFYFTEE